MKSLFMPQGDIPSTLPCRIHHSTILHTSSKSKLSLSLNYHENAEILCCLDGEGVVTIQDKHHKLKKGDILFIHSGLLHQVLSPDDRFEIYCMIINDKFCQSIGIKLKALRFETVFADTDCTELIDGLFHCFTEYSSDDAHSVIRMTKTFLQFFSLLTDRHLLTDNHSEGVCSAENTVKKSIQLIQSRYHEKLTLDVLASELFVNKFYLCKIFKQYTGMSIVHYINAFRLARARLMIKSGQSISLVSLECGFSNPSYFTKAYKKHYGHTPATDLKSMAKSAQE